MAAQSSFEFTSVVGGRGGGDVIFNITEGGLKLIFFVLAGRYCLSFWAPPPHPFLIIIAQSLRTMISGRLPLVTEQSTAPTIAKNTALPVG